MSTQKQDNFVSINEYVDDGCAATNFIRIPFQRMLKDIARKIIKLFAKIEKRAKEFISLKNNKRVIE